MIRLQEAKNTDMLTRLKQLQHVAASGRLGSGEILSANLVQELTKGNMQLALDRWITTDPAMMQVKGKIERIRAYRPRDDIAPPPVLITGPTGTGKELLARALEIEGSPFVSVNCGGLPKDLVSSLFFGYRKGAFTGANDNRDGYLTQAKDGVIFLDEIADLPIDLQATLLRAIQENEIYPVGSVTPQEIKCRFIAATKCDLEAKVVTGGFRDDLYARLSIFSVKITSLKEREHDIIPIRDSMLPALADKEALPPFPDWLMQDIYTYNVRAIQKAIHRWRAYGCYE